MFIRYVRGKGQNIAVLYFCPFTYVLSFLYLLNKDVFGLAILCAFLSLFHLHVQVFKKN
jgi:hypothetical protein